MIICRPWFDNIFYISWLDYGKYGKNKCKKKEHNQLSSVNFHLSTRNVDGIFETIKHESLFENSMSVSDGQKILCTAVETFCNLLMLLNLYFYITLSTLLIWTIKIIKHRLLFWVYQKCFHSLGEQDRYRWKKIAFHSILCLRKKTVHCIFLWNLMSYYIGCLFKQ